MVKPYKPVQGVDDYLNHAKNEFDRARKVKPKHQREDSYTLGLAYLRDAYDATSKPHVRQKIIISYVVNAIESQYDHLVRRADEFLETHIKNTSPRPCREPGQYAQGCRNAIKKYWEAKAVLPAGTGRSEVVHSSGTDSVRDQTPSEEHRDIFPEE